MKLQFHILFLLVSFTILTSFVHSKSVLNRSESRHTSFPFNGVESVSNRQKRNAHGEIRGMLSITNNFEVLRRRYLDTMKERNRQRSRQQKNNKNQIQENQSFLDTVG
eukprot:TRINITY_DN30837_c0_g1_i1.p1 TRINITY_DN30837_c0_g1~~TRINITY_DN30837_c0_g1_i1.p1  ORF type:complete len:108 (+),score=16.98 TRINITY_DN30837_c0_g1_i1:68-391(+)